MITKSIISSAQLTVSQFSSVLHLLYNLDIDFFWRRVLQCMDRKRVLFKKHKNWMYFECGKIALYLYLILTKKEPFRFYHVQKFNFSNEGMQIWKSFLDSKMNTCFRMSLHFFKGSVLLWSLFLVSAWFIFLWVMACSTKV